MCITIKTPPIGEVRDDDDCYVCQGDGQVGCPACQGASCVVCDGQGNVPCECVDPERWQGWRFDGMQLDETLADWVD